jgi:uncharacterized protein YutE (UPF0331/DUF86 family)
LGKKNVLEKEFVERIKGMAGYRNRLVQMYNQISNQEMYSILQTRLEDFDEFIARILSYIKR